MPLHIYTNSEIEAQRKSIFVNIPSYADPQIWPSIDDIFKKAKHKERVFIGVAHQTFDFEADSKKVKKYKEKYGDNLRIILLEAGSIIGCQPSRKYTHEFYENEDYYFNTDSHARMIDQWDKKIILEFEGIEKRHGRSAITAFGYSYDINNNGEDELEHYAGIPRFYMEDFNVNHFRETGVVTMRSSIHEIPHELPSPYISGHFCFTRGAYVKEVLFVDKIIFTEEELFMYLRFFKYGINVFNPVQNYLYHYFDRDSTKKLNRRLIWEDFPDKFYPAQQSGIEHFIWVVENNIIDKDYGLFDKRSLKDYEDMFGINFKNRTVDEKLRNITYPTTYQ